MAAERTTVRLDKWLQVARVFKNRSAAQRACTLGRVRVNGQRAKPPRGLVIGDRLDIEARPLHRILIVRVLADRPLPKADAVRLFEDQTPHPPPLAPGEPGPARAGRRDPGLGRPTKRDRREIDRLRRRQ